jgi:hypothetical protein
VPGEMAQWAARTYGKKRLVVGYRKFRSQQMPNLDTRESKQFPTSGEILRSIEQPAKYPD